MINLLFFNPLNLFPIVHLVRRDRLGLTGSTSFYHKLTSMKKGRMAQQLAVMTSKAFCHRALLIINCSIRWPTPSTRAKTQHINETFLWAWHPWAGSKIRGIVVWGSGRKPLDYDLPATAPRARQKARPPLTDVEGKLSIHHGIFVGISLNCFNTFCDICQWNPDR